MIKRVDLERAHELYQQRDALLVKVNALLNSSDLSLSTRKHDRMGFSKSVDLSIEALRVQADNLLRAEAKARIDAIQKQLASLGVDDDFDYSEFDRVDDLTAEGARP